MKIKVYGMLLGFAVFTGATFNLAKYSVQYFSAVHAAGWRFGIAVFFLIILLNIKKGIKLENIRRYGWLYFLLGIIGVFGFNTFFFLGMKYTTPLNGALIMATNPLLTTILAFFLLQSPITKNQLTGMVFALTGVVLVLTHGSWAVIESLSISIGDLLILLGNTCWALYGVLGRKYLKESSSIETTTYTMVVGAICLVCFACFWPTSETRPDVTIYAWGAILFMAIFTSVLGYLWWNKAMEIIGAGNTSLFFNFVPVVTMIISFITGTPVSFSQILGTLLVIAGVLISSNMISKRRLVPVKTVNSKTS